MTIEITDEMVRIYAEAWKDRLFKQPQDEERPAVRAGLAAVLAMPDVRQSIHDDVRRETEAKLRDLGVTGSSMEYDDSLEPSPAELGDTMAVAPGEWTPLDDEGTQIYVYGDQPIDIAFQRAEVGDEIRQLREELAALANGLLEIAKTAMPETYFATDSRCQRARRLLSATDQLTGHGPGHCQPEEPS